MSYYQNKSFNRGGRARYSNNNNRSFSRGPKKAYINPSKFIKSAEIEDVADFQPKHAFSDFNVHPLIKENIAKMGYTKPSPIQDQTIPIGLNRQDVVGIANTGTGKTAAFAVPLLNRLMTEQNTRAIILAPTRELAQQIEEQCRQLAKSSGIDGALLIGGVPMGPQLRELRFNPRIVIGTPGRIKDHSERRSLNLANFNIVVLDEVDRMLDMGFINDITHILSKTSPQKQSFYFSATLNDKIKSIINGFSVDPVHISVKTGETGKNIDQNVVRFNSSRDKIEKLHELLIQDKVAKTLVFNDTHRSVEKLATELGARGFSIDAIHGGKSQSQRQRVLKKFKDNQINVLVATDVAARGLDVFDITHVINYSSPHSYEDYVHRIGRTGRAGKIGYALTFIEQ